MFRLSPPPLGLGREKLLSCINGKMQGLLYVGTWAASGCRVGGVLSPKDFQLSPCIRDGIHGIHPARLVPGLLVSTACLPPHEWFLCVRGGLGDPVLSKASPLSSTFHPPMASSWTPCLAACAGLPPPPAALLEASHGAPAALQSLLS